MKRTLGACNLPELWPEYWSKTQWADDARRLRDTATHRFAFNHAPEPQVYDGVTIPTAGVHWHTR